MSSTRSQIRNAVVGRLQAAAIPGVKTVSAWRQAAYVPEELPALLVTDGDATTESVVMGLSDHTLSLAVVVMTSGVTRMDDITEICAAVIAAIGSDPRFGGLAIISEATGTSIMGEQVGNAVAFMKAEFSITYRTTLWQM